MMCRGVKVMFIGWSMSLFRPTPAPPANENKQIPTKYSSSLPPAPTSQIPLLKLFHPPPHDGTLSPLGHNHSYTLPTHCSAHRYSIIKSQIRRTHHLNKTQILTTSPPEERYSAKNGQMRCCFPAGVVRKRFAGLLEMLFSFIFARFFGVSRNVSFSPASVPCKPQNNAAVLGRKIYRLVLKL
ncbi:hypothetical protein B0T17DRAFT_285701 [Bombardia bombarda]|uniref:Uncharacterized protein n=1 Tax=Bombardia bombarda TaxID=252184 RepID=A0AA39WTL1_9PEZI|nr:hypothetical protein B0T17DRAFT_285701 [Bombardia bombarda]